ncbi:ATP-binding protein [Streptomyces abikoensis]
MKTLINEGTQKIGSPEERAPVHDHGVPVLRKRPRVRTTRLEVLGVAACKEEVRQARRTVNGLLSRWGMGADVRDPAELIVSELLTNALQHASPGPGGEIGLQVAEEHGGVFVEVEDGGSQQPPPFTTWTAGLMADEGSEHGRGLFLVDRLCHGNWGLRRHEDGHHSVWAYVPEDAGQREP